MSAQRIYVTTPIYYVNDVPHIGHVYTTTVCDVYARFQRFQGNDVFFLTGTDEHGIKVEKSAAEKNVSPQELADENAAAFRRAMDHFELTYDDFIRTTAPDHLRQVGLFVQRLLDAGAVYLGEFEGWYDEGQEEYYTETNAREMDFKSPVSGRPLTRATEKNYYFKLSAFQSKLEALFAGNPGFVRPDARRNEVLGRLRDGLQDVPMSRTNFSWGIPMPNDPEHVIYVWIEALMNYATAIGLAEPGSERGRERAAYWPATYHVIGKEILWFHAVIWPAMLMALDLPLPRCVYAHSFWISEGQKMSKSLGNFIDLDALEHISGYYSLDVLRYYLVTQGPLGATDSDFAAAHFHDIYHTDLVNTVGNCASRVTAMIGKYFDGLIPTESPGGSRLVVADHDWPTMAGEAVAACSGAMDRLDLSAAAGAALALIRRVDGFINATEPFKLAKDDSNRDELGAILYQCAESVRIASLLLWPICPHKMAALWDALGQSIDPATDRLPDLAQWGRLAPGTKVTKIALFPRMESPNATAT